ncbi:MAG: hypothetical protein TR69_WS6001000642 [candidate division WS6 bacterium OLB20]|uniref:Uncharacterized protein n=1 Tax=candidate division WS6 bacterium OLB20 TaxID=1617426 RepID=A0A136LYB4_9BACT|nr:MAG: hypothetical protein TR69_WS6001000642 [candidate division WS6 bacterium OLB20]
MSAHDYVFRTFGQFFGTKISLTGDITTGYTVSRFLRFRIPWQASRLAEHTDYEHADRQLLTRKTAQDLLPSASHTLRKSTPVPERVRKALAALETNAVYLELDFTGCRVITAESEDFYTADLASLAEQLPAAVFKRDGVVYSKVRSTLLDAPVTTQDQHSRRLHLALLRTMLQPQLARLAGGSDTLILSGEMVWSGCLMPHWCLLSLPRCPETASVMS